MSTPEPRIPLQLGQFVCRRTDHAGLLVGIVVGFVFAPVEAAYVRWANTEKTFEPLDALIEVLKLFG
jgi:hypothetical protein